MAGNQSRRVRDVSQFTALGDGRSGIRVTSDTIHTGAPFCLPPGLMAEFEPMSPYLEGVSVFMDDVHGGCSINHFLKDVEELDLAISTNAQSMAIGRETPELPITIGEIEQRPMSPFQDESGRLMDGPLIRQIVGNPMELLTGGSITPVNTVEIEQQPISTLRDVPGSLMDGPLSGHNLRSPMELVTAGSSTAVRAKGQIVEMDVQRPILHLPRDASSTLFVMGLPANCTRREASHIFRPFVGYKDVRVVARRPMHSGAGPLIFCFVDFARPEQAAAAMSALQGYKFDDHDPNSACLKLDFARARFSGGSLREES